MKITTSKASGGGFTALTLEHNGDVQVLTYPTFSRTTIVDHDKMFSITNDIFSKLSDAEATKVFDIYCEVNNIANERSIELSVVIEQIAKLTNELYSILALTDVDADGELAFRRSLMFRREYYIPEQLKTEYEPTHKRELTYLRNDYIGLCALAEATRFALPIWMAFMRSRQDEIGTEFKEYHATSLIYGTDIYRAVQTSRLGIYVDAIINDARLPLAAIHAGLADSEAGDFMTALALIRKIAIGETQVESVDLICNVSNYVRKLLMQLSKRFGASSRVVETPQQSENTGDDNTSTAENPRLKEKLPLSRYEEAKAFIRKYPDRIVTTITGKTQVVTILNACRVAVNRLSKQEINNPARLSIIFTVLRRAKIPPSMCEVLDSEYRAKLMAIAAASLMVNQDYLTYHLLMAKMVESEESLMMGGQLNSAVSSETLLKLNALYYMDEPEKTNAAIRRANLAHTAIQKIIDDLSGYDLEYNWPTGYTVPEDIGDAYGESLAKVIIEYDYEDPYTAENKTESLAKQALASLRK